jgi:two-component system CheB/CheR fusion protein
MTNSAKYTQAHGKINILVTENPDSVTVEISDNGAGISPEFLPRIFDLFSQADRTLDRSQGGLGIGLSVVRKLVEMHGGQVVARSEGLGRGATFLITLPRAAPPLVEFVSTANADIPSRRILIVDDNADAANSLSELLKMDGHETLPAFSAEEALSFADVFNPEIVLLDIGLPRMDGYEVAKRLRLSPLHSRTTLIALTGYGQQEDLDRAQAAGFDAHLVKPVDLPALTRLLNS